MNSPVKALSIKQPWAWLICRGYKDIENRNWRINQKVGLKPTQCNDDDFKLTLPTRIYIHASKTFDKEGYSFLIDDPEVEEILTHNTQYASKDSFGAIIGEVDIIDCVTESKSPWFVGKYGFVLANPVLYDKPIPCRGMVGFFTPNIEVKP